MAVEIGVASAADGSMDGLDVVSLSFHECFALGTTPPLLGAVSRAFLPFMERDVSAAGMLDFLRAAEESVDGWDEVGLAFLGCIAQSAAPPSLGTVSLAFLPFVE